MFPHDGHCMILGPIRQQIGVVIDITGQTD